VSSLDFSLLPDELRPLAPLIGRYAASDDVERSERLSAASIDELQALRDSTQPHWHAINAFLDEHVAGPPGAHQDVVLALDSFAQAAMEADLELEERGAD
jgi:hypothetical protein